MALKLFPNECFNRRCIVNIQCMLTCSFYLQIWCEDEGKGGGGDKSVLAQFTFMQWLVGGIVCPLFLLQTQMLKTYSLSSQQCFRNKKRTLENSNNNCLLITGPSYGCASPTVVERDETAFSPCECACSTVVEEWVSGRHFSLILSPLEKATWSIYIHLPRSRYTNFILWEWFTERFFIEQSEWSLNLVNKVKLPLLWLPNHAQGNEKLKFDFCLHMSNKAWCSLKRGQMQLSLFLSKTDPKCKWNDKQAAFAYWHKPKALRHRPLFCLKGDIKTTFRISQALELLK